MKDEPRVIVTHDLDSFKRVCRENGWNCRNIKYVSYRWKNFEKELLGYYADDIFPTSLDGYGRPYKIKTK